MILKLCEVRNDGFNERFKTIKTGDSCKALFDHISELIDFGVCYDEKYAILAEIDNEVLVVCRVSRYAYLDIKIDK